MRRTLSRYMLAAVVGLVLSAIPHALHGQIMCDVQVIHATKGRKYIDPRLKPIRRILEKTFGTKYTTFKLLTRPQLSLRKGIRQSVKLPNESLLYLTYRGARGFYMLLHLEISGFRTTVKVQNGGLFFHAGKHYQGGMLILCIRVRSRSAVFRPVLAPASLLIVDVDVGDPPTESSG